MSKIETFTEKIKKMSNTELLSTFQYVSGLFYSYEEKMKPGIEEVASDLNDLKYEIHSRMKKKVINSLQQGGKGTEDE